MHHVIHAFYPTLNYVTDTMLEPDGDEDRQEELARLKEWPALDQFVPVEEWHPSRFVFDDRGRLVLPTGPAHAMYGFLTSARTEVSQLDLNDPDTHAFLTPAKPGSPMWSAKRPSLNFDKLGRSYHMWDPRLQSLLAQVEPTAEAKAVSKRRRQWRDVLFYRIKSIRLWQLHEQAAALGISTSHSQRNGAESTLLALPAAGSEQPQQQTAAHEMSGQLQDRAGAEQSCADELAAAKAKIEQVTGQLQTSQAAAAETADELAAAKASISQLSVQLQSSQAAAAESVQSLGELRARFSSLSDAYSAGKEMFQKGKDELERRDGLHNALVESFKIQEEENARLAQKNERLGKRVVNVARQRDCLQMNLETDDPRQVLASIVSEKDELQENLWDCDAHNERLLAELKQAQKTIEKLVKQIKK